MPVCGLRTVSDDRPIYGEGRSHYNVLVQHFGGDFGVNAVELMVQTCGTTVGTQMSACPSCCTYLIRSNSYFVSLNQSDNKPGA